MFALKGIRQYLTSKLDADIGILKKHRNTDLTIAETLKDPDGKGEPLEKVTIINIPTNHVWIFDNELGNRKYGNELIDSQSAAFTSMGKKVETTILYHLNNRLYLVMIEMKRTISPIKYRKDIVKKFEQSLSTLSVFIAAHLDFPTFEQSEIFPIGVCCYNYYEDKDPTDSRDLKSVGGNFRKKYEEGHRAMTVLIEPLSLNAMRIPVLWFENPNKPISTNFELDFNEIISQYN
jgi:hypothetical protein